ncbi:MAG: BACON domain-containing protein [Acidobacteria bacterium]|nr:BACON domain-containing protein [Acidobacteriota bacterium]
MLFRRRLVCAFITLLCFAAFAAADDATLVATPDSLFFRQLTSTAPAPQNFSLSGKGATLGSFTATATSTGNWLSISPANASGATTIIVTPNTTGLAPGEYSGNINISATGFRSATVKVQLQITPMTIAAGNSLLSPPSVPMLRPGDLEFRTAQGGAASG